MFKEVTGDDVLLMYVHEKNKIREFYGMAPLDYNDFLLRAKPTWGPVCEKAAKLANNLGIDAALWVEACFRYASSKGHKDGPLPNCLASMKYATNALAQHLGLPKDVVVDKFKTETLVDERNKSFKKNAMYIKGKNVSMCTSVPAIDRFIATAHESFDKDLLAQALEEIERDRVTALWAESIGWSYESMADMLNTN